MSIIGILMPMMESPCLMLLLMWIIGILLFIIGFKFLIQGHASFDTSLIAFCTANICVQYSLGCGSCTSCLYSRLHLLVFAAAVAANSCCCSCCFGTAGEVDISVLKVFKISDCYIFSAITGMLLTRVTMEF